MPMSGEIRASLSSIEIEALQELIQANFDSRDGLRHAAEAGVNETLQSLLERIAIERHAQADELSQFVVWTGAAPRREGSLAGTLYRGWQALMESVVTRKPAEILADVEQSEELLESLYTEAAIAAVQPVLDRHAAAIHLELEQIRGLRLDAERPPD